MQRLTVPFVFFLSVLLLGPKLAQASGPRWNGHDFAFCFVTDDGRRSNLAWADTARVMGFRFTIAVNARSGANFGTKLTEQEIHDLWADGFDIGQHGASHGEAGLTAACAQPPRGSWKGYFLCSDPDVATRMTYLKADIERDTIATLCNIPTNDIKVAAYPRHWHGKALIDSLRAEGFLAARTGGLWDYVSNSNGEFTTFARNSWDGGVSMYRIPLADTETRFFGNHSAVPPVHKTYAEFLAAAQPFIDSFKVSGGIMVMYSHHLGDDNDTLGNINYGSGGVTKQDLAWLIDLVRANNGAVMTLSEAVSFYRARSHMENIDGDLVWVPGASGVPDETPQVALNLSVYPNPFNPRTEVGFDLEARQAVRVAVHDLAGRTVAILSDMDLDVGHHVFQWNGRDNSGRKVPSGTYLVQVRTGGRVASRTVTMIK